MSVPSLHEIAAMPFPASVMAMREHYNPEWGKPLPDGAEKRSYKVRVEYSYTVRDSETVTVEAFSEEEAKEKAEERVIDDLPWDSDAEVEHSSIIGEPS